MGRRTCSEGKVLPRLMQAVASERCCMWHITLDTLKVFLFPYSTIRTELLWKSCSLHKGAEQNAVWLKPIPACECKLNLFSFKFLLFCCFHLCGSFLWWLLCCCQPRPYRWKSWTLLKLQALGTCPRGNMELQNPYHSALVHWFFLPSSVQLFGGKFCRPEKLYS